jgi:ADP-ribosylglycohydrolase
MLPDLDRFAGVLLGGALGDALGRPAEGSHRTTVEPQLPLRFAGRHPGGITDDTEQTILVAESLLARGGVDAEDIAARLVAWLPHGTGKGSATKCAVRRLAEGVPWYLAGEDSAGNGAAMRAAPIGLWRHADPWRLRRDATVLALPTHRSPTAVAAAVAYASAIGHLVQADPASFAQGGLVEAMTRSIACMEPVPLRERRDPTSFTTLRDRLAEVPDLLPLSADEALLRRLWSGAFVVESLPAALYCFLRSPHDFDLAVATAIAAGHDTDTVASFVGGMFGALHGRQALPQELVAGLAERERLEYLAEALFAARRAQAAR